MFDDITTLTYADTGHRAVWNKDWWRGQTATDGAAALSKADGRIAERAETLIVGAATIATTLGSGTILMFAVPADIALLGGTYGLAIALGELDHAAIALLVVFCQGTQKHSATFGG